MKKSIITIVLLTLAVNILAQKISNIDFTHFKTISADTASEFHYPKLLSRLHKLDTSLNFKHYACLYYAHAFQPNYNPYNTSKTYDNFFELYKQEKFRQAIPIGLKEFKNNPVNIKLNFQLLVCYHSLQVKDSAKIFAQNTFTFINVILASGDGLTEKTAYVVNNVNDEYQILNELDLSHTSQALIETQFGPCDKLSLNTDIQTDKKNTINALYFNITYPFNHLIKIFD